MKRTSDQVFGNDWGKYNAHSSGNTISTTVPLSRQNRHTIAPSNRFPNQTPAPTSSTYGSGGSSQRFQNSERTPITVSPDTSSKHLDAKLYRPSMRNEAPTVSIDDGTLNAEQRLVVESVLSGYSTFFTGPAGSGKSHILDNILRLNDLGDIAPTRRIVVTATTGIAACNVGGVTIHSWSGIGLGGGSRSNMAAKVMGNRYAKQRWKECDVLIIDEISMLPGNLLDDLSYVASRVRNDRREFGGLQIVLTGDFFQLPPVKIEKTSFAFEAECWPKIIKTSICLKEIFRQGGDSELITILNEARIAELSPRSIDALKRHCQNSRGKYSLQSKKIQDGNSGAQVAKPTLLECRNAAVDRHNQRELSILSGETILYKSRDRAMTKSYEAQLKHCQAPEMLSLKVGATVILLKNIDPEKGLVNGVRGVVEDFRLHSKPSELPREYKRMELPVVRFDPIRKCHNESEKIDASIVLPSEWTNKIGADIVSSRHQIPLRLGYALTVHKSQGMTIPHLVVNLSDTFEYGQGYVALSRATSLRTLLLIGFSETCFRAHPKVKQFYSMLDGKEPSHSNTVSYPSSITHMETPNHSIQSKIVITAEQRQRMEENRQRAIEIRRQKQQRSDC